MKTSIKLLSVFLVIGAIGTALFLPSFLSQINLNTLYFAINYKGWLCLGFGAILLTTIIILFGWFLSKMKLSYKLFVITVPLTTLFISLAYFVLSLENSVSPTFTSLSGILRISTTNNNSWLWVIVLSCLYLAILFFVFWLACKPINRVEKAVERLGDGFCKDKILIGKGKQFKDIEFSLNKINENFLEKENLIKKTNLEYEKYIPKQFIRFLGKNSVLDLELGNQVKKFVTTLFCDLRNSTCISTTLSLEENFDYINSYLNVVTPLVRKYGGFVDKYMGDGVLAVFCDAKKAIECGHMIIKALQKRKKNNAPQADVGISISSGEVLFGVIGDDARKSLTIISDSVNFAGKMEEINKQFGTKLLFTKNTLNCLPASFPLTYRFVGSVEENKKSLTNIFESLEIYSASKRNLFLKNKTEFEKGVRAYNSLKFEDAKQIFASCYRKQKSDKVCYEYYNKCAIRLNDKNI